MAADLIVGVMSGTSLDGVDGALVDFAGATPAVLSTRHVPYPQDLKQQLLRLHGPGPDDLHGSALLANRLAKLYAQATLALLGNAGTTAAQVRAIGCHGQTIRHVPMHGYTLQLNNPALLAELTGIAVVADFRSRDIAAGGQGAPLVPGFHSAMFRDARRHRVILNLGGIANLTVLAPGKPTFGFDCGPGNMLMDAWAKLHLGTDYDDGGRWAATGAVQSDLSRRLLEDEFVSLAPPKSCGREQFNLNWLRGFLAGNESAADVQATLMALTVSAIRQAILRWCGVPEEVYVCGGGARNSVMLEMIGTALAPAVVRTTDILGLPAEWVEAVAFAWLAHRTLAGLPGNLPEVTGARGPRVLGAIYPA